MQVAAIVAPGALSDGDPQALGELCAARGAAVVAYGRRATTPADAPAVAAAAFAAFRRRVAAAEEPHLLDPDVVLLSSARDAARGMGPEDTMPERLQAAEQVYLTTPAGPLEAELAGQLLDAMIDAAPVVALDGDVGAVRDAARRHYAAAHAAPAAGSGAVAAADSGPAPPTVMSPRPPAPVTQAPGPPAAAQASRWVPEQAAPSDRRIPTPPPPGSEEARAARPHRAVMPLRARPAWIAWSLLAAVVLIAGVLALGGSDDPEPEPRASGPGAERPDFVRHRPRVPFDAGGGRFEVVRTADASWARELRQTRPEPGRRWVTVAVRTRNISRSDLRPGTLGHRLRTPEGIIIGPANTDESGALRISDVARLGRGERGSAHLGFQVPIGADDLTLVFDPGGPTAPEVRVPLGAGRPARGER